MRRLCGFLAAFLFASIWVCSFAGFAVMHEYYNGIFQTKAAHANKLPEISHWHDMFHANLLYMLLLATVAIDVVITYFHRWTATFFKLKSPHNEKASFGGLLLTFILTILGTVFVAVLYANKSVELGYAIFAVVWLIKVIEYFQVEEVMVDLSKFSLGKNA